MIRQSVTSSQPTQALSLMLDERFDDSLLISGRAAVQLGLVKDMLDARPGMLPVRRVSPLPLSGEIRRLILDLRRRRPCLSGIVAIGGGTTIDTAKGVAAFWHEPDLVRTWKEGEDLPPPGPRIAVIPTTAGSGSEATPFAAVYRAGVKMSIDAPHLLPVAAALAPSACASAPRAIRAAAAADALSQSLESIWSRSATTDSSEVAHSAFELLWDATSEGLPDDAEALTALCVGANLAGHAIAASRTTAAHALSYHLTHEYGVPHGMAVAVFLPALLALNLGPASRGWKPPDVLGDDPMVAANRLADRLTAIGVAPSLHAAGFTDKALVAELVEAVNIDRLARNPVRMSTDLLESLLIHQVSPDWRRYEEDAALVKKIGVCHE